MIKRYADDAAPCLMPLVDLNVPILSRIILVFEYKFFKAYNMFEPLPCFIKTFNIVILLTRSNAFSKSTNKRKIGVLLFLASSVIVRNVNIWVLQLFPTWYAVCNSSMDIHSLIRLLRILSYHALKYSDSCMPLQFLGNLKLPFFGIVKSILGAQLTASTEKR